jgi:hypothetical protein
MWIGVVVYNIGALSIKLMYFFQYYRIIRSIRRLRIIYGVIMTLIVLWTVGQIFIAIFTCVPVSGLWDKSIKSQCNPLGPVVQIWMNSLGNIVTDVIILVLPLPVVWRLKMPKSQKWALVSLFGLGFL